jgi:hypothetical protein
MYPGFDLAQRPMLFEPESDFSLYPEFDAEDIKPNTKYYIYAEQTGKSFVSAVRLQPDEYYVSFGFLATDSNGRFINMQYAY